MRSLLPIAPFHLLRSLKVVKFLWKYLNPDMINQLDI